MPHVVCLRPVHPEALALLRASPGVTVEVLEPVNETTIAAAMPKADAVIVRATPINREFLAHAPNAAHRRPARRRLRRGGRAGADRARHPADRDARCECRLRRRARDDADAERRPADPVLRRRGARAGLEQPAGPGHLRPRRQDRAGDGVRPHRRPRRAAVQGLRHEGAGARPLHPAEHHQGRRLHPGQGPAGGAGRGRCGDPAPAEQREDPRHRQRRVPRLDEARARC